MKQATRLILALSLPFLHSASAEESWYPDELPAVTGSFTGTRTLADGTVEELLGQSIPLGYGLHELRLRSSNRTGSSPYVILRGNEVPEGVSFPPTLGEGRDTVVRVADDGVVVAASLYDVRMNPQEIEGSFAGKEKGRLQLTHRERMFSPTLGKPAPEGAVVLFDGAGLDAWRNTKPKDGDWKVIGDALQVSRNSGNLATRQAFGDFYLHLEFRTPFMPSARGQARGNSGVYLQGRYEVQVLDSFGLEGEWNECGGIYKVARPEYNAALPPTRWQTYDIYFSAPEFDSDGKKVGNARVTIFHNGVRIHDDLELPEPTPGGLGKDEVAEGPLMLQNHKDPVQYRNIWIVPGEAGFTWEPLFNGKDLSEFTVENGFATYTVEDGVITGRTVTGSPNTFLSTKDEFADFELVFEVRVDDPLNSGMQIRSRTKAEGSEATSEGRYFGPQVEIEASPGQSGYIYGEGTGLKWLSPEPDSSDPEERQHRLFRNGDWNHYRIIAEGPRIRTYLNGQLVADLTHEEIYRSHPSGHIGLQVHSIPDELHPLTVSWRNLFIRRLQE